MVKLVARNSELDAHNIVLRRKLTAIEELYAALTKRSHASQKSIQTLVSTHWSNVPSSQNKDQHSDRMPYFLKEVPTMGVYGRENPQEDYPS